jgi:Trypsin-like peptidase domain/Gram-negative bacterial TonB protein C-terminal
MRFLRKKMNGPLAALALLCGLSCAVATAANDQPGPAAGDALSSALCPIVYPVDQEASERGYHYIFYGNGFFINREGYLLTAAHVLSQLTDSPPYIVLRSAMAPPRLLKLTLVAMDREHDVALLRATPNPFEGRYQVRVLPLAVRRPTPGHAVLAVALRPSRLKDPHTFDVLDEDRPAGDVLEYEFSQLDKGSSETQLLLFSHDVLKGDSGAPVVSAESHAAVGLVEGRWLRTNSVAFAMSGKPAADGGAAAAVPIHYAIALLQKQGVAWEAVKEAGTGDSVAGAAAEDSAKGSHPPEPLSVVAAAFPKQSLLGGEVLLDALVNRQGELEDIRVVEGAQPFVAKVLNAVQTWSFRPAYENGASSEERIGIVFQFAPPGAPQGSKPVHEYSEPRANEEVDHGALPVLTREPEAPGANVQSSVIVSGEVDEQGKLTALRVWQDPDGVASTIESSVQQWRFAAGKSKGENARSTMILVIMPRRGAAPSHPQRATRSRTLPQ